MSRTTTHIIEGKFRNGIIDYSEVPDTIKNKFDRNNFERGYFRNLRNKKKLDAHLKSAEIELK